MKTTITNLNSKTWYRLLKIIYPILFFVTLGISLSLTIGVVERKIIIPESVKKANEMYPYKTDEQTRTTLKEYVQRSNSRNEMIKYEDKYSLIAKIFYISLNIFIVIAFFEFIRRSFYYIVLGLIRPAKK